MLPEDFWSSASCYIAVNPLRPAEEEGVTAYAANQGWQALCFFQTSGSEGKPKWVALSKDALLTSANAVNTHFAVTAADRWLIALPLHHVGGFSILARSHLSGSTFVQDTQRWQPHSFAQLCVSASITLVSLVPPQVHDLVRKKIPCPPNLRAAIIGGGGMSAELASAALGLGWPVYQSYGMTEAATQIATESYPRNTAGFDETRLEILPHWQLRTDPAGQLLICGKALAKGYLTRANAGQWCWEEIGGTLKTRDSVKLWHDGQRQFLHFIGRESGFVKILGELIHLAPLQARLESLALKTGSLSMPIIVARPDARRGAKLVLVTEDEHGPHLLTTFNDMTEPLCRLAGLIQLENIPRTDLGKVDSVALQLALGTL